MKCKKCKKECLESELKDGFCQDCIEKPNKNNTVVTIIISVIISVVISLSIIAWSNSDADISSFKVESFSMDTEKNTYTYTGDTYSYTGKGKISCRDKETDYMVLIEEREHKTNKVKYDFVIVHKGEGEFSTFDSTYSGAKEKPEYEISIIGYRNFKK